jgi:hypothetical protein
LLTFSKRFNTGYKQYITNFKGDFDDNDDLKDAFRALLVDYKDNSNNKEELINSLAPSFFTLVKSLLTKLIPYIRSPYAKVLIQELNNQALMH